MTPARLKAFVLFSSLLLGSSDTLSAQVLRISPSPADGFRLPDAAIHRFGSRRLRHMDGITGAVVSPDGKLLATTGGQTVIVWDLKTLTARRVIRDPHVSTTANRSIIANQIAFTPDSKCLVVCIACQAIDWERDGQKCELAAIWDIATGERKTAFKWIPLYTPAIWVSADGKELGTVSGKAIRFFDMKDGEALTEVALPFDVTGPICVVGDRIATCSVKEVAAGVFVFDARTGKELHSLKLQKARAVTLSPDRSILAAVDEAGKVHVHDVNRRKELTTFDHPASKRAGRMQVSADGKKLYLAGDDRGLYVWDLMTNRRLPDVGRHPGWSLTDVALSPDDSVLYSVGWDSLVHRWDLKSGQLLPPPDGYTDATFIAMLPDRRQVVVADCAGLIDIWDLSSGSLVRRIGNAGSVVACTIAVSSDGKRLAFGRTTPDVQVWDLTAGKVEFVIPMVEKPDASTKEHIERIAFGPGDRVLYTSTSETGAKAWEVASGKKLWASPGLGSLVAVDPRGRWVAVGGGFSQAPQWEDYFRILDAKTGAVVRAYSVARFRDGDPPRLGGGNFFIPYLLGMTFKPDGSRLLTTHADGTVRVWDPETDKPVGKLFRPRAGQHASFMGGITCSPDGKWLAVGTRTIRSTSGNSRPANWSTQSEHMIRGRWIWPSPATAAESLEMPTCRQCCGSSRPATFPCSTIPEMRFGTHWPRQTLRPLTGVNGP